MISSKRTVFHVAPVTLCLAVTASCVHGLSYNEPIGLFTSVQGQAIVTHTSTPGPLAVTLRDDMLYENMLEVSDIIETKPESQAKALLQDDSLLSLGGNSRVEFSEYVYDHIRDRRSVVLTLARGKMRALIGRPLVGQESRFEIHTPSAKVAARGTYFVVWLEDGLAQFPYGTTGVVNIGPRGLITFSSGGQTVIVLPEQFSIALPDMPPSTPVYLADEPLAEAVNAIQATEVADKPKSTPPSQIVQTLGGSPKEASAAKRSSNSLQTADSFTPPAVLSGAVTRVGNLPGGTAGAEVPPTSPGAPTAPPPASPPPPSSPPPPPPSSQPPPGGLLPPLPSLR